MKNLPPSINEIETSTHDNGAESPISTEKREEDLVRSFRMELEDSLGTPEASEGLEQKLSNFMRMCESQLDLIEDPTAKSEKSDSLCRSEIQLMHELGDFYDSLGQLSSDEIDISQAGAKKLEQVRQLVSPDFLKRISDFYQSFEASLFPVLQGAATSGPDYFMGKDGSFSEPAARDVQALLKVMLNGNESIVALAKEFNSDLPYSRIEEAMKRKMGRVFPRRKVSQGSSEGLMYSVISEEIGRQTIGDLESFPPEILKNRILDQISANLQGMDKGLANQLLSIFDPEEEGRAGRILSKIDPARQLELFYGIVNMSIGFVRNARIQKALLFPPSQSQQKTRERVSLTLAS